LRFAWNDRYQYALIHSTRTAIAAVVSLLAARILHMPEDYWAAITTLVVMQSHLGAALKISEQRLAGTALGAVAAALLSTYAGSNAWAFAAGVFLLGMVCAALHLDDAYRFAGIALAIVMLVARIRSPWIIAFHRFVEVAAGIIVALAITALWPEKDRPV
jgi:uncharacterized membrane protein YgaE (UPF0421/DUF939 family)